MTSSKDSEILRPTVDQLNWQFALQGSRLEFEHAPQYGNLIVATLRDPERRVSAQVSLLGAQVLSLIMPDTPNLLYLSTKAKFATGMAIRGGIPLILGWFGKREGSPSHGFGRLLSWWPSSSSADAEKTTLVLQLKGEDLAENAELARDITWGSLPFVASLTIVLSESGLDLSLTFAHSGGRSVDLQAGFHPYFSVSDYKRTLVKGLEKLPSLDSLRNKVACPPGEAPLRLSGAIDQIFQGGALGLPASCSFSDELHKREISVSQAGCKNWVVWNPGDEFKNNAGLAADVDDNKKFLCVEPVIAVEKISLAANQSYSCAMGIRLTRG